MKIAKSALRSALSAFPTGIILAILFPTLGTLKATLCVLSILALIELVKADIRADICARIQAVVLQQHEDTRAYLRDWFDPEHIHSVYVNESNEARDKEKQKWQRFRQLYPGTKKGETNDT